METVEAHNKIINIINQRGPSLPVQVARELQMNSLFVNAFLSELVNSKKIKVSTLKVGGSPLYFIEGQEQKLENFYNYLHPREAEAYLLLKKNKILKDSEQEPAIRVALRSIKDFAEPFNKNQEVFWKFVFLEQQEIEDLLNPKPIQKSEKESKKQPKIQTKPAIKTHTKSEKPILKFDNPLIEKEKPKKQKPKSDFVLKTINFLNNNQIKILQEKDYKPKEFNCISQINSQLGHIRFLTQAKDKKTITELDLKKLLSVAQKIPLPALFLYTGNIGKKALEFTQKYSSILKIKKIS